MLRGPIRQPYESWKGPKGSYPVWNGIVPSNSRPSSNGVMQNPDDYQSAFGTARPLKQWRKQLVPPVQSSSSAKASGNQLSRPGGSVSINTSVLCPSCDGSQSVASVNTLVFGNNSFLTSATPNSTYSGGTTVTNVANNEYGKCISCDPESNVIKSGKTLLNKNYYQTTKGYLYSRGQTFNQKATPEKRDGVTYVGPDGKPLLPSDAANGPQVFNIPNCPTTCPDGQPVTTIYKPNNANYGVQGAVDSSTRVMRLKQQAMNKNGASFSSAYGLAAANAGRYSTVASPYFIKSKVNNCDRATYYRYGHKTLCF